MDIEFDAGTETRIVIGRVAAPSDPDREWRWQSSTTVDDVELTFTGFAGSEQDAILAAAARTIEFGPRQRQATTESPADPRHHEPGWWPGLDDPT